MYVYKCRLVDVCLTLFRREGGWMPPPLSLLSSTKNICSSLFREEGRKLPQTLSLTTLVCMEMLKALSAVSVNDSILRVPPWKNPWLLLGVAGPFVLHIAVLYSASFGMAGFGKAFGMVSFVCVSVALCLRAADPATTRIG